MKKILLLVLFLFPFTLCAQTNQERLKPKIEKYANEYHVPFSLMDYIVAHESGHDKEVVGDTNLTCNKKYADNKKRTPNPYYLKTMHARGLVQITDCYWSWVSDVQALDEDFSLNFLAYWIAQGKCRQFWTTCRTYPSTLAMK